MPIFIDGAQGDPGLDIAPQAPVAQPSVPAAAPEAMHPSPSVSDTVDAALRQPGTFTGNFLNTVATAQSAPQNTPVKGYNPLDTLKGTPHEGDQLSIYAGSQNPQYTKFLMAEQDQEAANRKTLDAAGWPGTVAGVAAGFIDPAMAIPIIGEERVGALAANAAYGAAFGAVNTARQPAATWQEGAENIATGAIIGGVLGKAASHLSGPEMDHAIAAVDEARPRINTDGSLAPANVQPQAAGAAPVDTRQLDLKGAFGLQKWGAAPNTRIYTSDSLEAKRAMNDIANTGLQFKPEDQVAPHGPPLENIALDIKNRNMAQAHDILEGSWLQHYYGAGQPGALRAAVAREGAPSTVDKLSYSDFDKQVGIAMHNGDQHAIPEVQQAAQDLRSKIFDPVAQMAKDTKDVNGTPLLSEDAAAPKGAQSFFPLMPDRDKIVADHGGARQLFTDYLEREQNTKVALQERIAAGDQSAIAEWKGKSALKPDEDPEVAAKRMLAKDTSLSRQELESRAREWTDRLIGSPDGRLDYDVQSPGAGFNPGLSDFRGSLRERKMPIDVNELIKRGYVNTSATQGIASLLRSVVPDVLLTRRFGDVAMTDTFKRIQEEYAARALPGTDTTELFKARDGVISDLAAVRDRLRGVHGWDQSPLSRKFSAGVRDFQNYNSVRQLGTSSVVRLTDLTNGVFRYGMNTAFHEAWIPLMKSFMSKDFRGVLREQAKDAGLGVDGMLGHIRHNLYDIIDAQPQNRFSRGLGWLADKSMLLNLHGPLTDAAKSIAFHVSQGELGRMAARVVDGTVSAKDLERLAQASISRDMAARISEQYEAHHIEVSGRKFVNLSDWTDSGAREAFGAAMQHESSMHVMQAGIGDKPRFMDYRLAGLLTQYRNFMAAAHEKILLANLQQFDARTLQGFVATMGMGYLATFLYKSLSVDPRTLASGQGWPKSPADWTKEAIDRAAMTGWFGEINRSVSGASHGQLSFDRLYGASAPPSRRADVDLSGQFLGPTMDFIQKGLTTAEHAVTSHETKRRGAVSNFTGTDLHNVRLMLPLQNLMGFRILLDNVEKGIDNTVGFKVPKSVSHEDVAEPATVHQSVVPVTAKPPRSHHAQKADAAGPPVGDGQSPAAATSIEPPPPPAPRRKHRAVN